MEDPYIYFELNNRRFKINRENSEDIWIWYDRHRGREVPNPHWKSPALKNDNYIRICCGNQKYYLLHRIVYYAHNQDWDIDYEPRKNMIDHIDRNTRNNHISNLRVTDVIGNGHNRSNTKGYWWNETDKRYRVIIKIPNKKHQTYIGQYKTEEEARQAYLDAKKLYHKW